VLALPEVSSVEEVKVYVREREGPAMPEEELRSMSGPASPFFGRYGESAGQLAMIDAIDLLEAGYNGSGPEGGDPLLIGVLDTGFRLDHDALSHVDVHQQYDFVNLDGTTSNEAGDHPDQDRHGTLVLGVIAGYHEGDLIGPAWGARYLLAKTEIVGQEIHIEEDNWIAGLEWCDSIGADIVTSSLGYIDWYSIVHLDGNTALCTRAADIAGSRGIVVCNAAGNYGYRGATSLIAPADGDSVLAIGGVGSDGTLWSSSSRGPTADGRIKPDLVAQGSGVSSVVVGDPAGYGKYSGTSFATPLVAGLCAQLLEIHPDWAPMQLRDSLFAHAELDGVPNNDYGYGIPKGFRTSGLEPPAQSGAVAFSDGYPNPFSESIRFDIVSEEILFADVNVYDSGGRLVRTLMDGQPLVIGGTLVWDGRNNEGTEVSSGVYFVDFRTDLLRKVVKVVRIR
jgi:subtilisin family serine protease